MTDALTHEIVKLSGIDARLELWDWPFARERRAEIDANWFRIVSAKPAMFNGRVLLQHRGEVRGDVFHARYFETDYAAFIARLALEAKGPRVRNGFAMAALQSNDGAFLLGVMGAHTHNAGRIYFAAGTPDLSDVMQGGEVDLAGSVMRELEEETGLHADEVQVGDGWTAVMSNMNVAFMRQVRVDLPAEDARALILSRLAKQDQPELSDIYIVRSGADLDVGRLPAFMIEYLRSVLV